MRKYLSLFMSLGICYKWFRWIYGKYLASENCM